MHVHRLNHWRTRVCGRGLIQHGVSTLHPSNYIVGRRTHTHPCPTWRVHFGVVHRHIHERVDGPLTPGQREFNGGSLEQRPNVQARQPEHQLLVILPRCASRHTRCTYIHRADESAQRARGPPVIGPNPPPSTSPAPDPGIRVSEANFGQLSHN